MGNYSFEPMIERRIKDIIDGLSEKFPHIDDTILRDHNDICPNCKTPFKNYKGVIQSVGAISAYMPYSDPLAAIVYCVCQKCTKAVEKLRRNPLVNPTEKIEEYIEGIYQAKIDSRKPLRLKQIDLTQRPPHYFSPISQKRIEERLEELERKYSGFRVDTTVLNYFNSDCPTCKKPIKADDGIIHGADAVNAHVDAQNKTVFPYVICGECAVFLREFMSKRQNAQRYKTLVETAKSYIQEVLYEDEITNYMGRY